jgi:hypothetical protein
MLARMNLIIGAVAGVVAALVVAVVVIIALPGATVNVPPKPTPVVLPQDTSTPLPIVTIRPSGAPDVVIPSASIAPFGDQ